MPALITVDNPEIIAVGVSQNPGLMAPAINAKIMPNEAVAAASWFDFDAPALNISIGGTAYVCLPQETSVEIDPDSLGIDVEVQYYPETLVKLQNTGLKKNLVFLSAQKHEQELLEGEYDEDEYEVLFKECDIYVSNGWTINDIIKELASRAGVTVSVLVPAFHVPNPTVIFKRGQKFLPFIKSLLPGDFEYSWSLVNNAVTVSLVQPIPDSGVEFVDGMYRMLASKSAVPAYDFVEIRGGYYKWGTKVSFGESEGLGSSSSYPDGKVINEELDPEVKSTSEGEETHYIKRRYKTGPAGKKFFALLKRDTKVTGPYASGSGTSTKTLRETAETFEYENDEPITYLQPRQTSITTESRLIYTKVASGMVSSSGYQTYWMTDDARVLTPTEFNAIPVNERPTVVLAAFHTYGLAEKTSETFSWVSPEEADKDWFEGTQTDNTLSVQRLFVMVNNLYYDAALSPKELLQQVLTDITTKEIDEVAVSTYANDLWKTAEINSKKIKLLNAGSFQSEQSQSQFDTKSGSMVSTTNTQAVNGRPPGNPSKYRTEQLKATLEGDSGGDRGAFGGSGGETCIPFMAEIMTNNPDDFETWAGMLWEQVSSTKRRVSMVSFDRLLPMGSVYGGVTMTSFQASQAEDGTQSVVMGGV